MKVVTIVGARPQFVKAAVVSIELARQGLMEAIIHTGQHYDTAMSDVFFEELSIGKPARWLGVGSGSHGLQTGRMLERIEAVLQEENPDWVLVYGDTNSTLAGALAAVKLHIPVAHVEAGLRSYNRRMPEETNRVVTDHISERLYAPTESASQNLIREGIDRERVELVGDVMYDAVLHFATLSDARSQILDKIGKNARHFALATVHRAENTDDEMRLVNIIEALNIVAERMDVVLPLHPRTRSRLESSSLRPNLRSNISLIEPVGYLDMLQLEKNADVILTDSGGVQKEAFFFRVPCITLREETEWVELVESGWNRLWSPVCDAVEIRGLLESLDPSLLPAPANLYGDGHAAASIARSLVRPPCGRKASRG